MTSMTRRESMKGLFSLAATAGTLLGVRSAAQSSPASQDSRAFIPSNGIGRRIRHVSYSDQGGRPDGVQIMVNRRHVYVGHMFNDGVTILDAADPRRLKPVGFFTAGAGTRTHHLQVADDVMLLANGANIVAMQSYDNMRGYFENNLADSITNRGKFRSGLSIHDISRPAEMKEIAFLEMPGFGINRLWWPGGRYAYVSAHFDGFIDHILCIVDLKEIMKPEIVSRWWLPGMNRAAGETPTFRAGRRVALHHMITAGDRGYAAWRDGGFTIHDISDAARPKLLSHINWSPPFPGGTHTPLPLPGRNLAVVVDEANAEKCAKGTFYTFIVDVRAPENPVPISTLPTPRDRDFCSAGVFGPHNLHENRPGSLRSEEIIFATYNNAGLRVFDIRDAFAPKEIASWVPPVPQKLIDPRPNVGLAAKTCDVYVTTDGLMYVTDWNGGMHVLQYEG
ncbi:MAG: hypothetical protein DMG04_12140 [Acidobacteria bacterium]|nr:MAG: hypothetical protein DMG04_12140 [Acidobacteriota bacterium]